MQQDTTQVVPFVKKKRDEMTYGYLPDHVLPNLVPDMSGSAKFYSPNQVRNLMMEMDSGFVGMRRSTIDKTEAVRQLILYTTPVMFDEADEMKVAVYQRVAGAEAKLKDGFSFGLGGHLETLDLAPHMNDKSGNGEEFEQFNDCPSSYFTTLHSGFREVNEEIQFLRRPGKEVHMPPQDIVNDILKHFSFTSVRSAPSGSPLNEITENVVFASEQFVLVRAPESPEEGLLLFTTPTPVDEVYRKVFGCEPMTNKVSRLESEILPYGFLSDYKPEQKGFIGNTHIAVLGLLYIPGDLGFVITEPNYTTIGWMTKAEVREAAGRFEAWSAILIPHLDEMEVLAREEKARFDELNARVPAPQPETELEAPATV